MRDRLEAINVIRAAKERAFNEIWETRYQHGDLTGREIIETQYIYEDLLDPETGKPRPQLDIPKTPFTPDMSIAGVLTALGIKDDQRRFSKNPATASAAPAAGRG